MRRRAWAGARAATPRTRRAPAAYEGAWMSPFSSRWSSRIVAISATRAGSSAARLERESAPTGRYTMGRCSTGKGEGLAKARTPPASRPRHSARTLFGPRCAEESTTSSADSANSSRAIAATLRGTSSSVASGSGGYRTIHSPASASRKNRTRDAGEWIVRYPPDPDATLELGWVSHDPLSRIGVEEEPDARERRF